MWYLSHTSSIQQQQLFRQVCPSMSPLVSDTRTSKLFKHFFKAMRSAGTCSTVRGLILLATQDGIAEYLEAQANLKYVKVEIWSCSIVLSMHFKSTKKKKMKSHFELKRTALQRPATTAMPRRMDTKESWTPSRYLEGWRKYWKTLKPFESSATYVFATWTPRSKAVPRTRSIWFQRLRSQSSEDLLVLHYTHHIRR